MFGSIVIALALVAVCAVGWISAEFDLRATQRDLDQTQLDLDVALGWHEQRTQDEAVVHTTLHLIGGGETS